MISVNPRARRHEDRAGDPLDGLVNLFDVGIVLAVAFLLAALASLHLTHSITTNGLQRPSDVISVPPGATVSAVPTNAPTTGAQGVPVGTVYRTRDGRLIVVVGPSPTPSPTQ